MFAFTKQEQRFLLFLATTFCIGLCIKYVRNNVEKPDETWQQERQKILADFEKASQQLMQEDSAALARPQTTLTKESLTHKININNATRQELETLPRIGPVLADNIVKYRQNNGPFETIADIQKVNKIGPKTFEKIKVYITVE
jgi:comEA protein